jgi:hypothetical protein
MTDDLTRSPQDTQADAPVARRNFLRQTAAIGAGLALGGATGFGPSAQAAQQRTYSAGSVMLEVDGTPVGGVLGAEGGFPRGDVVVPNPGPDGIAAKHLGGVRIEDIDLDVAVPPAKPLLDWIAGTLNGAHPAHGGALVEYDFNHKESSRLVFQNALISSLTLPKLDAASKESFKLGVTLAPERTQVLPGTGKPEPAAPAKLKAALESTFKLTIPGVDCHLVNTIESITIKQLVVPNAVGTPREVGKVAGGKLEVPNLTLTVAESGARDFYAWFSDMVIKGVGPQARRQGRLDIMDVSYTTPLFSLGLSNLGISSYSPMRFETNSEKIPRVKIELFCDKIVVL